MLLVAALVIAVVVKALFLQAFYIPSGSMEPGLVNDDRILVQKVSSWFGGSPHRGDVVVFDDPGGWLPPEEEVEPTGVSGVLATIGLYPTGGHLVKRVIGVAGDTITCCDDQGRLLVNGVPIDDEPYVDPRNARLDEQTCYGPMVVDCTWSAGPVPEGSLFVMGDNRSDSGDSTVHLCLDNETNCTDDPYVKVDEVVGRVFAVAWPLGHAGLITNPGDFDDVPDADATGGAGGAGGAS